MNTDWTFIAVAFFSFFIPLLIAMYLCGDKEELRDFFRGDE